MTEEKKEEEKQSSPKEKVNFKSFLNFVVLYKTWLITLGVSVSSFIAGAESINHKWTKVYMPEMLQIVKVLVNNVETQSEKRKKIVNETLEWVASIEANQRWNTSRTTNLIVSMSSVHPHQAISLNTGISKDKPQEKPKPLKLEGTTVSKDIKEKIKDIEKESKENDNSFFPWNWKIFN